LIEPPKVVILHHVLKRANAVQAGQAQRSDIGGATRWPAFDSPGTTPNRSPIRGWLVPPDRGRESRVVAENRGLALAHAL